MKRGVRNPLVLALVVIGCQSEPDDGHTTHFQTCIIDADCSGDMRCVDGTCERRTSASGPLVAERTDTTGSALAMPLCIRETMPIASEDLVAADDGTCSIPIPIAPDRVEGEGLNVTMDLDGRPVAFAHVAFAPNCSAGPDGWLYGPALVSTTLTLCPGLCARVHGGAPVTVVTGCPTISGPLPAAHGPPDACRAGMEGGAPVNPVELEAGGCGFELGENVDPLLREYEFALGWLGISYVPRLPGDLGADCARVLDGWYRDNATDPPTVRLCPQTCAMRPEALIPFIGCDATTPVCLTDVDCGDHRVCNGVQCVECVGDADCPGDEMCWAQQCVARQ
jgi:hypothetical protein